MPCPQLTSAYSVKVAPKSRSDASDVAGVASGAEVVTPPIHLASAPFENILNVSN